MKNKIAFVPALLLASPAFSQALQPQQVWGDAAVKAEIEPLTREIYDRSPMSLDWVIALTRDDVLGLPGGFATEISGKRLNGDFARILVTGWARNGKYAGEYYRRGGTLLFVFESFESFDELAKPGAARNFRKLATWERRSWYREGRLVYSESAGMDAAKAGADGETLRARASNLAKKLEEKAMSNTKI